jgi:hypothetical protein
MKRYADPLVGSLPETNRKNMRGPDFVKFFGLGGAVILLCALSVIYSVNRDERLAVSRDGSKKSYGSVSEGPLPCSWAATPPERVISENRSQSIVVSVKNTLDEDCRSEIELRAPGFDISPQKESQVITLASASGGSVSWILTPRKTGSFEISVSDIFDTKIFGITVKTMFGLTSAQAKAASAVGGLMGPMLTLPWWIDKFWSRKKIKPAEPKDPQSPA